MRIFNVVCLIAFFAVGIFSQSKAALSGTVSSCGKPEPGLHVQLFESGAPQRNTIVETDAEGRYSFENIAPGKYFLRIGAKTGGPSFYFFDKDPLVLTDSSSLVRDIILPRECGMKEWLALPDRPQVFISAGAAQTIEQVSKSVDVIDGQQLRDRADFALIESLRTIPGFRVAQSGGFGRVATIKTRGLRNQDTAVLLDGVRFRDPTAITGDASPFLSDLTLTSVSKIEVLRGSGSSLYGTNAIGGVIDLQTPETRSGTHGQVSVNGGGLGFGRFRGLLSHGTANGKFGIGGGVSRTVYTKGIDGDDRAANTNVQTRVDVKPTNRTNVSGKIFFSDANVRLNTDPDTTGALPASPTTIIDERQGVNFTFDANDPDRFQKTKFFSGQINASHAFDNRFVIAGYYHGLKTKRKNDNGPLGAGFQSASTSLFDGRIDTANARVSWTALPQNTLTAGYEFEREKFGNDGRTPSGTANFFTRAGQRSNTFYVQDLVSLDDGRFQLAGGFRVQQFSLDRPEFSLTNAPYSNLTLSNPPTAVTFDGATSYFFRKTGTKLRAHVGNGYRVPSLYERFGTFFSTFPSNSFIAIGDPFLKPEKTIAFDAGVEQNLASDRVRLSATYFWTRLRDVIGFGNVVPNIGTTTRPFGGYENQKGGKARGGEFSVNAKPTDTTDIFASYTFTDSVQRTPQLSGSGVLKTLGVPDHQFTLVATQRYKRFWVNFDLLATSDYLAPLFESNFPFRSFVYRFKGNRKGDLTAGYTFGFKKDRQTLRLYGTIENVFDQEYYENGIRTSGVTARAGLTFGF